MAPHPAAVATRWTGRGRTAMTQQTLLRRTALTQPMQATALLSPSALLPRVQHVAACAC